MDGERGCSYKGLSGTELKGMAMVFMLVDHIGAVILFYMGPYWAYLGCRMIGRLAFPMICFFLTEGFIHTRDRRNYCLRMAVFAVISEIPFDLAVSNQLSWDSQNVFFELLVGLIVLQGLRKAEGYFDMRRSVCKALALGGGCLVAWAIRADYSYEGILLMSIYYLLREQRLSRLLPGSVLAGIGSLNVTWGAGALSLIPLYFYNGSRGKGFGNGRSKYLFYWFYPVHLLILFGIRRLVLGIPVM